MDPQQTGPSDVPLPLTPVTLEVNWQSMGDITDGYGRSFPTGADDADSTVIVAQQGSTTALTITRVRSGAVVEDYVVPLPPGMRSGGMALCTPSGWVYAPVHGAGVMLRWIRCQVPGWTPPAGGPGPGPQPGGGVTRDEVAQMINDALSNFHPGGQPVTQADADLIVATFAREVATAGHPLNSNMLNNTRAAVDRQLPAFLKSSDALLTLLKDGLYQFFKDRGYESALAALQAYFGHGPGQTTAGPTGEPGGNQAPPPGAQ